MIYVKVKIFAVNRDFSCKGKEKRAVTYTCRYFRVHLMFLIGNRD